MVMERIQEYGRELRDTCHARLHRSSKVVKYGFVTRLGKIRVNCGGGTDDECDGIVYAADSREVAMIHPEPETDPVVCRWTAKRLPLDIKAISLRWRRKLCVLASAKLNSFALGTSSRCELHKFELSRMRGLPAAVPTRFAALAARPQHSGGG